MNASKTILNRISQFMHEEKIKTSTDVGHYHEVEIDDDGNGKTVKTIGGTGEGTEHEHTIKNGKVAEVQKHVHVVNSK